MKRLIVNADDFGLTEGVNRAILEAHRDGILTSTTLLANGAAFQGAVALSRRSPHLGVGVHLNLTHGRSVSDPARIPSLVTCDGVFRHMPGRLAAGVLTGRVAHADVERELRAQIEKALAAGIIPTHLDGHKHFHMPSPVLRIVISLAREFRIQSVRCAVETSADLFGLLSRSRRSRGAIVKQYLAAQGLRLVSFGAHSRLSGSGLSIPDRFFGITCTGFLDRANLVALLCRLPEGSNELMCHPGYLDEELRGTGTRLLRHREEELEALKDSETRHVIDRLGIELTNYKGLWQSR